MSTLKIKDFDSGQWISLPILKGEKGDVYNLLDSITSTKPIGVSEIVNPSIVNGTVNVTTGAIDSGSADLKSRRLRVDPVTGSQKIRIVLPTGIGFCPVYFDSEGNFLSSPGSYTFESTTLVLTGSQSILRLMLRNSTDTAIVPADADGLVIQLVRSTTTNGVSYQWVAGGRCKVIGNATANSDYAIHDISSEMPEWILSGARFHILFSSTNVGFSLSCYSSSGVLIEDLIDNEKNVNDIYTIPDNTGKIQIEFNVANGTTVNEIVYPRIYLSYPAVVGSGSGGSSGGGSTGPSVVTVTGTTPTIVGEANTRYICGQVSTLSITPPVSGIIDVLFTSGSSATVLTLPSTVKLPEWFAVSENKIYEINIMDGVYGAVMVWDS